MQVLLVDDSPAIRKGIGTVLLRSGHDLDLAEDGLQGLRFALKRAYDLILSDIQMPVMDGLKFIGRLRMGGPNVKTPILVFSSCRTDETVLSAAKLGVQGYLLKPTDEASLLKALDKILQTLQDIEGRANSLWTLLDSV